jgi:NRPS condensation-like uncharacterized protein
VTSPTVIEPVAPPGAASDSNVPRQRERFGVADELTCYYDRPAEPANVHLEVRVPGRLDAAELRAAIDAVLTAEPRLGARKAPRSRWRSSYYWEWPAGPGVEPVFVASCADAADLDRCRAAFLSRSPSLDQSPPFLLLLAAAPDGDRLILNAHHARLDGMSCLRLLSEVALRYGAPQARARSGASEDQAGQPAAEAYPVPELALEGSAAGIGSVPGSPRRRARPAVPLAAARIARQPAAADPKAAPGYGACLVAWDGLAAAAERLRDLGCSVNDLLIAGLIATIARWNAELGARSGVMRITMPIGDRTQAGTEGSWANRSRLTVVSVQAPADATIGALLGEVAAHTSRAKDTLGPQVDVASRILTALPVPTAAKGLLLRAGLRTAGSWACDTSLVSNLGVVEPIRFGGQSVDGVWFSTSAHMPRGLSLGAVTLGTRVRLTFRYRRALFDDAAAAQFASTYSRLLDHFARQET